MVVMYLMKHTPLLNHPETFKIYSTPFPLVRDGIYGWSLKLNDRG